MMSFSTYTNAQLSHQFTPFFQYLFFSIPHTLKVCACLYPMDRTYNGRAQPLIMMKKDEELFTVNIKISTSSKISKKYQAFSKTNSQCVVRAKLKKIQNTYLGINQRFAGLHVHTFSRVVGGHKSATTQPVLFNSIILKMQQVKSTVNTLYTFLQALLPILSLGNNCSHLAIFYLMVKGNFSMVITHLA